MALQKEPVRELLGIAVKRDRLALNLTQDGVDNIAHQYAKEIKYHYLPTGFCGRIERCVKRDVSTIERQILARCLQQDEDRYEGLETDPRKVIGRLENHSTPKIEPEAPFFERSIIFPAEYKQSGVSILSYFAEVVARKYPENDARIAILQSGQTVTLRVETSDGLIEEIERTLETYGMVVTGQMPIESLTNDRELIRDLKTRLEVTGLELRLRQEAYLEQGKNYNHRIESLEDQLQKLHILVSTGLSHATSLSAVITNVAALNSSDPQVTSALYRIENILNAGHTAQSQSALEEAFEVVRQESPSMYGRLLTTFESIPAQVMATLAAPWVQGVISSLSK